LGAYVALRLLQTAGVLALASVGFFFLTHLQPGGVCGPYPSLVCQQEYGINQPLSTQYLIWLGRVLHGNFGESIDGTPVLFSIMQGLPATALLVLVTLVLQQAIAIPLGILGAVRRYSVLDRTLTFLAYCALSVPVFILGIVLLYLIGGTWGLLPVGQITSARLPTFWTPAWFTALWNHPALMLGDLARHLALPVAALMVTGVAIDSRFMRAAMLQTLHQDYIRTARAKGLAPSSVIFKHALRNALLPMITNIGLYLPALLSGVLMVEVVFSWPGLGFDFYTATGRASPQVVGTSLIPSTASAPDYPTITALLLLGTLAVLLSNLLADVAYAVLDPRIRVGQSGET